MDPEETCFSLHSSLKNAYFQDESYLEDNLDSFSKLELLHALKEAKNHNFDVEHSNKKIKETIEELTKSLSDQNEKCTKLEKDKSFLRTNIKKASASWFQRKVKLSESENDECSSPEPSGAEAGDIPSVECDMKKNQKDSYQNFIAEETVQLFTDLKYKEEQFQLSEQRCAELNKRVKDYEKVIDDQEVVIHGLENQLDTYFTDNEKMSKQLVDLHKLFLDLESINEKQVDVPPPPEDDERSANEHLPTPRDFKQMSGSVAKTYMKLKELIYEKKSLVTEIERLRTLNVELQNRVSQQELRLINVSDALQTTWLLVSNLKDEHAKIHTAETILRYELKEKREVLNRLKDELECSREQWQFIRQMNSESEQEWTNLREELDERRKLRKLAEMNGHHSITQEEIEVVAGASKTPDIEFEPPIDLLVNMGIEYGVVSADDEETTTAVALVGGEDVHENRLQNLEEQCCFLYQKLMTSTSRALTLASRLTSLHQHYADSDEEYDEDDDENEQFFNEEYDEDEDNLYETQMLSPDSESHDTAYVSEAEGADSTSGAPEADAIVNEGDSEFTEVTGEDSPDFIDDNADVLSKRLINFLPKKIEILKASNEKLEEKLKMQQEEKAKIEGTLNDAVEFERRQRRQLEQQLSHLGKCVDELKLERNGKIAQVEEELRKKIEQVEKEEKEHIQLCDELESLKEKFEERGHLLQLTSSQLEEMTKNADEKIASLQEEILQLRKENLEKRQRHVSTFTKSSQTDPSSPETRELASATDSTCETEGKNQQESLNAACQEERQNILDRSIVNSTKGKVEDSQLEMDSQLKQLIILTNSCQRIPFHLTPRSILCWTCYVAPQEILFSIYYDDTHQLTTCSSPKADQERATEPHTARALPALPDLLTQPSTSSSTLTLNATVSQSRILLKPLLIESSSMATTGRLIPKVPGHYSFVFHNLSAATQEVSLKFWLQPASPDEEPVSK